MYSAIVDYCSCLTVTQGQLQGKKLELLAWQRKFLRNSLLPDVTEAALTMGRGGGKTTLIAAIGCAFLEADGVKQPGSEITVIASTIAQGQIIFDHVLRFLDTRVGSFSKKHSEHRMQLRAADTTMLRVVGANPGALHGAAPSVIIADEIAQWAPNKAPRMLSALRTGLGKIPNARMFTLGTRGDRPDNAWEQSLRIADYAQIYSAPMDAPLFQKRTWKLANPTLRSAGFDTLLKAYQADARKARHDPDLLQSFRALRLNQGVSEVIEAFVLDIDAYERCIIPPAEFTIRKPYILGIDLGGTAAMSAIAAYSLRTRCLDVLAMLPNKPNIVDREISDGVSGMYRKMIARNELQLCGEHVVPVPALLEAALARWGVPAVMVVDRWRLGELQDALSEIGFPNVLLNTRGQGFKDGAEDVRLFRRAAMSNLVHVQPSLLLTSAINEARLMTDPAGNQKLAKVSQGGRRSRGRDDALAAAIIAVAEGVRQGASAGGGSVYKGLITA